MKRYYYGNTIESFIQETDAEIIGKLATNNQFELNTLQRDAWVEEIKILKNSLAEFSDCGSIYLEYSIPRLGRRIDAIVVIRDIIYVLEFKIGADKFTANAIDQVWDYALDLKNFHQTSHDRIIVPILIASKKSSKEEKKVTTSILNGVINPIHISSDQLSLIISHIHHEYKTDRTYSDLWEDGRYSPTPTIIEAAQALYAGHKVSEISRTDASATNLTTTISCIEDVIKRSKESSRKSICFVTGVPGAGKTLVGLDVATRHINKNESLHSVFLSGNGPLVSVMREALAIDHVNRYKELGKQIKKGVARSKVKMFIQNVHHFRDECLVDKTKPPIEHVAIFDEAQRAWNISQTSKFMQQKKGISGFDQSEPEYLISCMDRHEDWAVVICLVGGGQEINTGEAGIKEWIESVNRSYPNWDIFVSSKMNDAEYGSAYALETTSSKNKLTIRDELHLGVSMRSFRAENVSRFVKQLLDGETNNASETYKSFCHKYPIMLTRNLSVAKDWLRNKSRGSERFGVVVSSRAQRLKPLAFDVRVNIDPIHWFLAPKNDVRSSCFLEDAATEFRVQGLELDWTCVTWDGDFRKAVNGWEYYSFKGKKWQQVHKEEIKTYLMNAYRVLLTRARQGMIIVVPLGDSRDPTRHKSFYDTTYEYFSSIGIQTIE